MKYWKQQIYKLYNITVNQETTNNLRSLKLRKYKHNESTLLIIGTDFLILNSISALKVIYLRVRSEHFYACYFYEYRVL